MTAVVGRQQLIVIEAPGKLRAVWSGLRHSVEGLNVVATLGHVEQHRPVLQPLGIRLSEDHHLVEDRFPARPNAHRFLRQALKSAGAVVIATDGDAEGHAIAADVARLAAKYAPGAPVTRMIPLGLDAASLVEAWRQRAPLSPEQSLRGVSRRIADRMFAASLSRDGHALGRVQAAMLVLSDRGRMVRTHVDIAVPAADGGRDFLAHVPLPAGVEVGAMKQAVVEAGSAILDHEFGGTVSRPFDGADALLAVERELGLSIDDASALLQDMYERGDISYPRTDAHAFTGMGGAAIARLAQARAVLAFRSNLLPCLPVDYRGHEALRVLREDVNPLLPSRLARSESDAVLSFLARQSVESGVAMRSQVGRFAGAAPDGLAGISLRRDIPVGRLPWGFRERSLDTPQRRSPEAAVVAALTDAGIGRPSTVARHACRFAASGFVDEEMQLTADGRAALARIPEAVRASVLTGAFEEAIEGIGDVEHRVRASLVGLGAEGAWQRLAGGRDDADGHDETPLTMAQEVEHGDAAEIEFEDEEYVPAYRM